MFLSLCICLYVYTYMSVYGRLRACTFICVCQCLYRHVSVCAMLRWGRGKGGWQAGISFFENLYPQWDMRLGQKWFISSRRGDLNPFPFSRQLGAAFSLSSLCRGTQVLPSLTSAEWGPLKLKMLFRATWQEPGVTEGLRGKGPGGQAEADGDGS